VLYTEMIAEMNPDHMKTFWGQNVTFLLLNLAVYNVNTKKQ